MKKSFLTTLLLMSVLVFSTAQDIHFGFQMSPSWSWMSTNYVKLNGSGSNLGLKLGVIAENRFSQSYSLSTGIGFHFNGGGSLLTDLPSAGIWQNSDFTEKALRVTDTIAKDARFRYKLTYIEIPIGLKLRTPESGDHMRYYVEPGLVLGIRSSATGTISGTNSAFDQTDVNIGKDAASLNLSWGIGAGAEYIVSNNFAVVVGLHYQNGFIAQNGNAGTLIDAPNGTTRSLKDVSATSNNFTLRLGVMF